MLRLLMMTALTALAATPLPAAQPDPLDPRAATRPLAHRSAFDGYRRFGDEPTVPWREANDTVKRIGGWRAYAREAAAASAPLPAASSPAAVPAPSPAATPERTPGHRH